MESEYVALDAHGTILRGEALAAFASLYAAHYANSADIHDLVALPTEEMAAVAAELRAMRAGGVQPVLSYELWLQAGRRMVHRFTAALGQPLHVVAYVRDPVSWLRSLYWQRRHAEPLTTREWIDERARRACWATSLSHWRSAPNVVRLDVRLGSRGIMADFAGVMGWDPALQDSRCNGSISGEFARFLVRHDVGDALSIAEAKFAWERWSAGAGDLDPLPEVFGAEDIASIMAHTMSSSLELLEQCDNDIRARIKADRRWWSAEPSVHAVRPGRQPADAPVTEADRLLELTLTSLVAADGAWRQSEQRLRLAEARAALSEAGRIEAESARMASDARAHDALWRRSEAESLRVEADSYRRAAESRCAHAEMVARFAEARCHPLEERLAGIAARERKNSNAPLRLFERLWRRTA